MSKFLQPADAIIVTRCIETLDVAGTPLRLTQTGNLFGLRFGDLTFDTQWTDEAQARDALREEHRALSSGMDANEEGSGWAAR